MLRKIRRILAAICFLLITLLFVDFTGVLHLWFDWLAKIQFLPAVLALNAGVILFLVLLTLVGGRIYCSVICPLGVFQDIVARIGKGKKKMPYTYSKPKSWLRYVMLILLVVAFIAGIHAFVALLDPYGIYGRMANNVFQPVWIWGNNLLAAIAERIDSYAFYRTDIWLKSLPTFIIAIAMAILVIVLAWRNGRTYCNTICPVGTILGFLSRFSLFRISIDKEKCNKCTLCARNCKASCIDTANYQVDHSRCVACMNCIGKCKKDAIHYRFAYAKKTENQPAAQRKGENRREFLASSLLLLTSSLQAQVAEKAEKIKMDGGLADIIEKKAPKRQTPITPPGSSCVFRHVPTKYFVRHSRLILSCNLPCLTNAATADRNVPNVRKSVPQELSSRLTKPRNHPFRLVTPYG